jgi:phosphonate transport system substrate-binding protein
MCKKLNGPRLSIAAVSLGIYILAGSLLYGADNNITLAIVIDGSNQQDRAPLQAYLTKAMGQPVVVEAPGTFKETVARLADGSYDFACLGALVYIRARANYGVIPLVQRVADLHYHSVFITGAASSIHSLRDLKGKKFAFGDIDSTSAHLIAYRELKQAGINPETDLQSRYSGSHPATAAMVANGTVDAGAIDEMVFDFLIRGGQVDSRKVRVFYTSKPYLDYVYVARKDVSEEERERFVRALLALRQGSDDSVLKILRADRFVAANDQEYTVTRQIAHELDMF